MPDRMAVHLPSFLNNTLVYNRMKEEFKERREEFVCKSQFLRLWNEEFPQVSIPKVDKVMINNEYNNH